MITRSAVSYADIIIIIVLGAVGLTSPLILSVRFGTSIRERVFDYHRIWHFIVIKLHCSTRELPSILGTGQCIRQNGWTSCILAMFFIY